MTENHAHTLSIQVSLDGFSFYTINPENRTKQHLGHYDLDKPTPHHLLQRLKAVLQNKNDLAPKTYGKVQVIHHNKMFALVPTSHFDAVNAAAYLQYNTKILKTDFIAHDDVVPFGIVNVYIPFTNVNNFIFEEFGSFSYYHHLTAAIDSKLDAAASLSAEAKKDAVSVHLKLELGLMDVLVFDHKKLLLANTFIKGSAEDLLYYVLFVMETLHLDRETVSVTVTGADSLDQFPELLYKYIRNVTFTEENSILKKENR